MKKILIIDDDIYIGDLVLLDLMLPGLNGEEVLPQIEGIQAISSSV